MSSIIKSGMTPVISWERFGTTILPFVAGFPMVRVSSQMWIVSLIILFTVAAIDFVSFYGEERKVLWSDILSGSFSPALKGALSFVIGTAVFTLVNVGIDHHKEKKNIERGQEQFMSVFSDMANIELLNNIRKNNQQTIQSAVDSLRIPRSKRNLYIGCLELFDGNYYKARECFNQDESKSPLGEYFLGRMHYLGLDDAPSEEGLELITRAAENQVIMAQEYLFYRALRNEDSFEVERWAKEILLKKIGIIKLYPMLYSNQSSYEYIEKLLTLRTSILNIMKDLYIKWGDYEKALIVVDQYGDLFPDSQDFVDNVKIDILLSSGNLPHAQQIIRKGCRRGSPDMMFLAAEDCLGLEHGTLPDGPLDVSKKKIVQAEKYLRAAVAKQHEPSKKLLIALYESQGEEYSALVTDHFYSALKLLKPEAK